MFVIVPDRCRFSLHHVLRVAETAEANDSEQSALHHHQAKSVRDGAHEGISSFDRQTDAVVHQIVDGSIAPGARQ